MLNKPLFRVNDAVTYHGRRTTISAVRAYPDSRDGMTGYGYAVDRQRFATTGAIAYIEGDRVIKWIRAPNGFTFYM